MSDEGERAWFFRGTNAAQSASFNGLLLPEIVGRSSSDGRRGPGSAGTSVCVETSCVLPELISGFSFKD